jgi:hypothetical protein
MPSTVYLETSIISYLTGLMLRGVLNYGQAMC